MKTSRTARKRIVQVLIFSLRQLLRYDTFVQLRLKIPCVNIFKNAETIFTSCYLDCHKLELAGCCFHLWVVLSKKPLSNGKVNSYDLDTNRIS